MRLSYLPVPDAICSTALWCHHDGSHFTGMEDLKKEGKEERDKMGGGEGYRKMGEKSGRKEEGRGIRRKTSHRNGMRGLRHVTERLAVGSCRSAHAFYLEVCLKDEAL